MHGTRIRWSDEREHTEQAGLYFVTSGHAGLLDEPLFEIRPPAANDGECWTLTSSLPGWQNRCLTAAADADDSRDFLQAEAEIWLAAFLVSIGAVFTEPARDEPGDPEPITDVPMVCTACRKPAYRVPGLWAAWIWAHRSDEDARACPDRGAHLTGTPVMAMVAAGNESVPR